MSKPMTYEDPFEGIAGEIVSAMSALNMEPQPLQEPRGIFLSERDEWANHALEHLHEAMKLWRQAKGRVKS